MVVTITDTTLSGLNAKLLAEIPKIYSIPNQSGYSMNSPTFDGQVWTCVIEIFLSNE